MGTFCGKSASVEGEFRLPLTPGEEEMKVEFEPTKIPEAYRPRRAGSR
jgi:hypothetical protein